jgi:hypothetical protein
MILNNELDEAMGFKKLKEYDDDEDESGYASPKEENDEDFYLLKRKEDRISYMIMKNFTEFSVLVIINNVTI